ALKKRGKGKPLPKKHIVESTKEGVPTEKMWADVASAGLTFLDKLGKILIAGEKRPDGKQRQDVALPGRASDFIERDNAGRSYMKLPIPGTETLRKVADLLYELAGGK
ncbi:MAG: hypothetical protein KAX38_00970, partial [Candidatus Krumholzibacteria bacterium]|nr:hypothetical protein [Candidatus Krumholzibacteria bacterium]